MYPPEYVPASLIAEMLEHVPELVATSEAVPVAGGPYRFAA